MKQFLLDQFNNFGQDVVDKFQADMTGPLPTFARAKAWETNIWGYEPNGFWYTNKNQTYFFEENGTVHTLGILFKPHYYNTYKAIYKETQTNTTCHVRVMMPIEMTAETLTAEHHFCGLTAGSEIYYMKFETPDKTYGQNVEAIRLGRLDAKIYLQKYIKQLIEVFFILRKLNLSFMPTCSFYNFFVSGEKDFFMFIEDFILLQYSSINKVDGIDKGLLAYIKDNIEKNNFDLTVEDKDDLINDAKNQCYIKILEDFLDGTGDRIFNIITNDIINLGDEFKKMGKILPVTPLLQEIKNTLLQEIKEKCLRLMN